jgi:hypothetical protein
VRLSGLSPGGSWKFGPELASSRPIRPRSVCLGASAPIRLTRRVPESLLATISQSARPSPLNPDVWNRVLSEAEVPGKDTIVAALRHGVPLSLEDAPFPGVRVPNHPMLYFDLPRVQAAVDEEVQHGRYVVLPPSTDPSLLNLSAMGVAPRFQSFEVRRAFEGFSHQHHRSLKHAALDDFGGRSVSGGPGLASLGTINDKVKWRVIHDLSHPIGENVNSFVESPYFELPTAVQFARRLSRGAYIWKGDVDKAFRIVPVRKRDWPLLAFHIDGVLYVDTRLPFGHGLSPYYFVNLIGRPVLYVAVRRGASLLGALAGYVDDFFGGCDTYEKALEQMELWLKVCADLGVPVSKAKTFLPSQIVEILGFIIDTVNMSISVDPERIQDILDEMARIEGRKAVRKDDLERLAGKMVFVCSVVPGGRTFMREILNTMNGLRQKKHWAHLSAGFQSDLRWWKRFALKWNGVESIPPPISIPWRWLTSDASGEHGLGVFVCGAAVHVPLPLDVLKNRSSKIVTNEEQELIIAETELIAMVLLVAVAAVLFPGEHLLLGADNTVAISWFDKGTSPRPRAMRALRLLWRVQATYRVHITARYMPSDQNTLSDAASRRDAFQFFRASREWLSESHFPSLNSYGLCTNGRASLLASSYGASGGAAGLLVQYLVEGHDCSVSDSESQVDRILNTFSTLSKRFVAQEHRRLHHVPRHHCEKGRDGLVLRFDQGLRGLFGPCDVLYLSPAAESSSASGSTTVSSGSRAYAGETSRQGGTVHAGTPQSTEHVGSQPTAGRGSTMRDADCDPGVLGMPSTRCTDSEAGRKEATVSPTSEPRSAWDVHHRHSAHLQDNSVWRKATPHRSPSAIRSALVPLESIDALDLRLATPIIPDPIVRAVHDQSYNAVSFAIPDPGESHCPFNQPSLGSLVPSGLRSSGIRSQCANMASDASRRLEDSGSGHVVCRGRAHSKPTGRPVEPRPVREGWFPPD